MPELLVLLLMQVTIFSSVTALILIAVKQIFKCRIPPHIGVVLWVILLARLICPVFPESKVSVYNLIPVGKDIMYTLANDIGEGISEQEEIHARQNNPYIVSRSFDDTDEIAITDNNEKDTLTLGEYYADMVGNVGADDQIQKDTEYVNIVIVVTYLTGVVVSLAVSNVVYNKAKRRAYLSSYICEDERLLKIYHETAAKFGIREDKIPPLRCGITSMLIGCISPQIVCREDMDEKEESMVFAHELIHYKYHDNPILLFSTVVSCFFWYNPLIWIVRNMLRDDVEVLCDSRTLTYLEIPHTEYAYLLCRSSAFAELAVGAGCHMSASGRRLKNRLRTISFEKHKRFLPKFASLLLCSAIMMLCLTNPIVSQNSDYSVYIENYADFTGEDERAMHLSQRETVSSYLGQITKIMDELVGGEISVELKAAIGNGSFEKFRRLCRSSEFVSSELSSTVQKMRADDLLSVKNCIILNDCIVKLLEGENNAIEPVISLLPKMITENDMNEILSNLTDSEKTALLKCYNKGVNGAEVDFDYYYSSAMMKLISERINNKWMKNKFTGFYQRLDEERIDSTMYDPLVREVIDTFDDVNDVYICDSTIRDREVDTLCEIIGAAKAGQNESVYYLKETEDGCTFDLAERIIRTSGFTLERIIAGYAEIGERTGAVTSANVVFPTVRFDSVGINTPLASHITQSANRVYSMGLIDADANGMIDMFENLSCGQGIYYAYKLVVSAVSIGNN